jgi:hypothetical protein
MTVFFNAGDSLLCTSDGVCVIVYVKFSSVGAGTVWGGGRGVITAVPNTKLCAWGEDSGGHVL